MTSELATVDPDKLDSTDIFSHLPPNRCGELDRKYIEEVLADGFGNWESAEMLGRFEAAFAGKFGVPFGCTFMCIELIKGILKTIRGLKKGG